jgi:hypothetical protein
LAFSDDPALSIGLLVCVKPKIVMAETGGTHPAAPSGLVSLAISV